MENFSLQSQTRCPLCGQENRCSMAGCDGLREPCWCEAETFPEGLVDSLPEKWRGVVCICRTCVVKARRSAARAKPLPEPGAGDFYVEAGMIVFTAAYHRRRGYCCGGGCRHCPFEGLERELAFP